jgi:hypothetical protein
MVVGGSEKLTIFRLTSFKIFDSLLDFYIIVISYSDQVESFLFYKKEYISIKLGAFNN